MSRVIDIQKQELEEELASLSEQYTAVNKQRRQTKDERERLLLKKQADDLLEQMQQVEEELEKLENSEDNYNQANKVINQIISKIDYKEARCQVDDFYEKIQDNGGEALFFIDNFNVVAGKYFISEIIDRFKCQTNDFKFIEIDIEKKGSELDEWGLIQSIGEYFNVNNLSFDIQECLRKVIHLICQSLQNNKVIIIEIRNWDILYDSENILNFFLNEFWLQLIKHKGQLSHLKNIKIITLISASIPLINYQSSTLGNVIKLELTTPWEKEYIQTWIAQNNKYFKFESRNKIINFAERVYLRASNGIPCLVCEYLYQELEKAIVNQNGR